MNINGGKPFKTDWQVLAVLRNLFLIIGIISNMDWEQ